MFRSFRVQGLASARMRALSACVALFAMLTSCTEFVENTRVAIVIDAEDDVREQIRYVELEVRAGPKNASVWDLKASPQLLPRGKNGWPLQFQFKRDEGDNADSYLVKATARTPDDEELLVLLAMSTYVKGETIELTLRFDKACVMREMPCPKTFTCEQGECKDPIRDAMMLPTRKEPDKPADTGPTMPATVSQPAAGGGADPKTSGGGAAGCSGSCAGAPASKPSAACPARDTKGACLPCPVGFLGADADSCKPVLSSLAVPGLTPAFAPEITDYNASVSLLRESVKVMLAAVDGVEVQIDGQPLGRKSEWISPALEIGSNPIVITLNAPGRPSRSYKLDLKREAEQAPPLAARSTAAGDAFGFSVAVSGNRMLVGAPFEDGSAASPAGDADDARKDSGCVYLYEYTKDAGWIEKAYIKAETPAANEHFGFAVAMDGDRFAVGASNDDGGAVYTFELKNGVPVQTEVFRSNPQGQGWFGRAIALHEDRLVVGVASDNTGADEAGSVMVYERDASGWQFITTLRSETPGTWDYLGSSVATEGDLIVSGATGKATAGGTQFAGVVYVFERGPAGWKQVDVVSPPMPQTSAFFGESVSLSGNTLATASFNGLVGFSPGVAHVFTRGTNGKFTLAQALRPNNSKDGNAFGQRVLLTGDVLLISAPRESSGMQGLGADGSGMVQSSGAVYLFSHASGTWEQQLMIKTASPMAGEYFGMGLVADGERFMVGGSGDILGEGNSTRSGAVYVFQ